MRYLAEILMLLCVSSYYIGLWIVRRKDRTKRTKEFERGVRDGEYLIKTYGFDAADNVAEKLTGAYKSGVCTAMKQMEGPEWHRTLKKR